MKILMTGATGLVGRTLLRKLLHEGHDVRILARSPNKVTEVAKNQVFKWSDSEIAPSAALSGVDAIVHLAGEGIADKRWSVARKQRLRESRVLGTENLVAGIQSLSADLRPKLLISASAIGFYGDTGESEVDESANGGSDFLAKLCQAWEQSAQSVQDSGMRVVHLRTGIVLARDGGALAKMAPATIGNGKQWMSWIHIDDLVQFIIGALMNASVSGAYNLVSPNPVRNREFTRIFAKALAYPFVGMVPKIALKLVLGEMADMLLASQRILPMRMQKAGFNFEFPDLASALANLYKGQTYLDNYFSANQFVPLNRSLLFPFFSLAENLETLTPPWLNFRVTKKSTPLIEESSTIDYRLKIHGVPVGWRTLIREWNVGTSFVDEQMSGPYKRWIHRHLFEDVPGGTLLRDEIVYRVPGGVLGKIFLSAWIRGDVNAIFSFRQNRIREIYLDGTLK